MQNRNKIHFCDYTFEQEYSSSFIEKLDNSIFKYSSKALILVNSKEQVEKVMNILKSTFKDYEGLISEKGNIKEITFYSRKGRKPVTFKIGNLNNKEEFDFNDEYREIFIVGTKKSEGFKFSFLQKLEEAFK